MKEFSYASSNILSITFKGNLQNTLIYGPETVYQDYMGVIVTASVNISTGTILVDHSYTAIFP